MWGRTGGEGGVGGVGGLDALGGGNGVGGRWGEGFKNSRCYGSLMRHIAGTRGQVD